MANYHAWLVRILAVVALVLTVLAAFGWIACVVGFGLIARNVPSGLPITGPGWDPYWTVSVLSPILFIVMIAKSILMIIKDGLFRKFFIIHILAVLAFIMTMIVLCFVGYILVIWRSVPQSLNTSEVNYFNANFAGALVEVLFLGGAWICHILAFLFGGVPEERNRV